VAADPKDAVAAALRWHGALHVDTGANRAARARLRRCGSVLDAVLLEETHGLLRRVHQAGVDKIDDRVAVLATIFARVKPGESRIPFARALGQTSEGRKPQADERQRLSPARFGALMRAAQARDWDGFARAMRRALAILGDASFNMPAFISDVLFLNDRALQRWTYAYWQTTAPADDDQPQPSTTETEPVP
jgi:CRISPR type I-E-associated protein CasB/Cse2